MKIIEIGTGYTPIPAQVGAATEIVVEKLVSAFCNLGLNVELIDIMSEGRATNELPISEVNVPAIFCKTEVRLGIFHKIKRVVYSICLTKKLRKIVRKSEEKCVLHFHNQYNLFFFLLLTSQKIKERVCIIYTNHSGIWNQPWDDIKRVIYKKYFQEVICMKKADKVFLLNPKTKENVVSHLMVPSEKICLIDNGVDTEDYRPLSTEEILDIKQKYSLKGKKILMQVGSVIDNKGQLRVIQAIQDIFKNHEDFVYAYVGGVASIDYQEKIKRYAEDNGLKEQIRYLGTVKPGKELNELYNIAEITIVASGFESFSLVTIESLAAGTPVFINGSVPIRDEITCKNYYCIECLSKLVEKNMYDTSIKEYQQQQSREYAVQNYDWKHIANKYLEGFER